MEFFIVLLSIVLLGSLVYGGLKLAPWVPTRTSDVGRIFELAQLKPGDLFYDLGCGNGKIVLHAARNYPVQAVGIEIGLPLFATCLIRKWTNKTTNATFKCKDFFHEDLSQADVVYVFGMPETLRLGFIQRIFPSLKPGAKIISYVFAIEGLEPIRVSSGDHKGRQVPVFLYQK